MDAKIIVSRRTSVGQNGCPVNVLLLSVSASKSLFLSLIYVSAILPNLSIIPIISTSMRLRYSLGPNYEQMSKNECSNYYGQNEDMKEIHSGNCLS